VDTARARRKSLAKAGPSRAPYRTDLLPLSDRPQRSKWCSTRWLGSSGLAGASRITFIGSSPSVRERVALTHPGYHIDMVDGIYYEFIWFPSKSCISCQPCGCLTHEH